MTHPRFAKNPLFAIATLFFLAFIPLSDGQAKTGSTPGAGKFGLGFLLGEPTSIGGRYWMTDATGLQFWVGGSSRYGSLQVSGDYIIGWENIIPVQTPAVRFDFSLGGGLSIGVWDSNRICRTERDWWYRCYDESGFALGARMPLTFSAIFPRAIPGHPLEAFVEVAPGLFVAPDAFVDFKIDGGIGGRFYF